ncbi:hypothetical protein ASG87_17735 [Frateuria sp. Soil773]|uniref:type III secretion HpaP family protein n=1 Tax=Frateuria sp. Soil773 TaxID=1736407 RepID=UPI0006F8B8D1|nr:type III secretion HpaP family protein [Frateuria sp. Soil773]KRE94445.1 hypothetical protein ASG87_17735 [Frateuria sp. Soil773]
MHGESVSSSSSSRDAAAARQATHKQRDKADPAREREDAPRFRKLMEKRGDTPDEEVAGTAGGTGRKASPDEQALRELLQSQLGAADGKPLVPPRGDDDGRDGDGQQQGQGDGQSLGGLPVGLQFQQQAQQVILHAAQQPAAAGPAMLAPALAELIERHVKQLLVPDASSRSSAQTREIMLTLKDDVLPGTELWLSRTEQGWRLRADTRSADSYRALVDGAPQLIERFAAGNLGTLEIDPILLG